MSAWYAWREAEEAVMMFSLTSLCFVGSVRDTPILPRYASRITIGHHDLPELGHGHGHLRTISASVVESG